ALVGERDRVDRGRHSALPDHRADFLSGPLQAFANGRVDLSRELVAVHGGGLRRLNRVRRRVVSFPLFGRSLAFRATASKPFALRAASAPSESLRNHSLISASSSPF